MSAATTQAPVTTAPAGTGSTIVPTLPTGHAVGDEIRIFVVNSGVTTWSAPAGWTIKRQQASSGNASTGVIGTLLFHKVVAGDTLPLASPTCTLGATVTRSAVAFIVRGADLEGVHTLPEWLAFASNAGNSNPIRPTTVTTLAPEMLVHIYYGSRSATNAPEQTNYTQVQQVINSGIIVNNVSEQTISDQNTVLSNQDASPTGGARWIAIIGCTPSPDYPYYRSGSQAFNANGTAVTPALPTGTTASDNRGNKDLVVLTAQCAGADPTLNTPGDWTLVAEWSNTTSGGNTTVRKWITLYTGALDRQVNRTPSGEIFAYLSVYHNAHQSIPIGTSAVQQNASSTTATFPALPRTGTHATVQATCVADATPTFTAPSGWTERNDSQGVTCADQSFNPTGTTASASFTLNSASPTLAGLMEVFSVASVINLILTPTTATLTLSSFAPTIVVGADITVTPDAASLTISTFAPTITIALTFPQTSQLDDFNRTDGPLGANWGGNLFEADGTLAIDSNAVRGDSPTVNNNQGWVTQFGPDCEVWVQITSGVSSDFSTFIAARWSILGTDTPDGYAVRARGGDTDNLFLMRFDNGALTGLTVIVQEVDDGDWLGLRVVGDRLDVYFKDASGSNEWQLVGGATDGTYSAAGHIGLLLTSNTIKSDNFGGGTLGPVTLEPAPASLVLIGFAPTLQLAVTPTAVTLALTSFAPTLVHQITPASAPLALTTFSPTVTILTDFPETAVLDDFNRADQGPPPSANWSNGFFLEAIVEPGHSVKDNQLINEFNDIAQNWWNVRQFGPNVESYITVNDSTGLTYVALAARLTNIVGFTSDGYMVQVHRTGVSNDNRAYTIWRIDEGVTTLLVSTNEFGVGSMTGDQYGIRITGNVIELIGDTGSGPEVKLSATDSTYSTAGYIGIATEVTPLARFDNFGGGTLNEVLVEVPSASLTLTTFAPSVTLTVTVPSASLSLTTFAPTVDIAADVTVTPAAASLTLTAFAAQLQEVVTPASQSLVLTAFAVNLVEAVTPGSASLSLTTFAPAVTTNTILTPVSAALTLTTTAPQLRESVTPNAATLSLATFAPAIEIDATVTPAAQSLTLTGFAPQLQEQVTPAAATLTITTFAPAVTISADITVTPPAASLTLTQFAPALHERTTPAASTLTLTTFAPEVTVSADRVVQPANASLALQVFAPQLQLVVTPASAVLVLSTSAPSLQLVVQPGSTSLVLATFAPTVEISGDITVTPAQTNLTLTAFAPVITTGGAVTTITPTPAILTLTSYAPWLFLGLVPARRTYVVNSGKYEVEVSAGEYEFVDNYEDDEVLV